MSNQFTAAEDFYSPEFQSHYLKGMVYTVRPGNEKLAALVPQWVDAGKVLVGKAASAPLAKVSGVGAVV